VRSAILWWDTTYANASCACGWCKPSEDEWEAEPLFRSDETGYGGSERRGDGIIEMVQPYRQLRLLLAIPRLWMTAYRRCYPCAYRTWGLRWPRAMLGATVLTRWYVRCVWSGRVAT
jgi:hypothetical protein